MILEVKDKQGNRSLVSTDGAISVTGDPQLSRHLRMLLEDTDLPFSDMRAVIDDKFIKLNEKGIPVLDKSSNEYMTEIFIGRDCTIFGYTVTVL